MRRSGPTWPVRSTGTPGTQLPPRASRNRDDRRRTLHAARDRLCLGIMAFVASCALRWDPRSPKRRRLTRRLSELRQLLADQRAALDRQAQIIEEQGRRLAALQSGSRHDRSTGATDLTCRRRRQRQPRSGLRPPCHSSRQAGRLPSPRRICPRWSFQQEISRVRSAFPGPSRPSSSAVRRDWSRFTR